MSRENLTYFVDTTETHETEAGIEKPEENRLQQACRRQLEVLGLSNDVELTSTFIDDFSLYDTNLEDLKNSFENEDVGIHERK